MYEQMFIMYLVILLISLMTDIMGLIQPFSLGSLHHMWLGPVRFTLFN